jgi:Flp pilus assembly protein TadB
VPATASPDLERALGYIDGPPADRVVRAGYGAALLAGGLTVAVVPVTRLVPGWILPVLGASVGLVTAHIVHRGPVALARLRRTRALGEAPGLVGRVVLRLRLAPAPEEAAAYAARTGEGPLAASLRDHVGRARGTPGAGFETFLEEWAEWDPGLDRGVRLALAAAAAPPGERERGLDRALTAVLEETRDRVAAFAADIHGPATALYAFGVLLPVALVGLLPAAHVSGVHVPVSTVVCVYDVLLPAGLLGASAWLLVARPVAFPPPSVDRSHPAVPDRRVLSVVVGAVAGVVAWPLAARVVAPWSGGVAAAGIGIGAGLLTATRPVIAVRDRTRAVEADLDDALYLVGRRVADGRAVETALSTAADETGGATGDILDDAVGVARRLGIDVGASFRGPHGALSDLPSPRTHEAARLVALAAREGPPAGEALVALAEHLEDLRTLEQEGRRDLARVTGTLRHTAVAFAPVVTGATVALADGIRQTGSEGLDAAGPPLATAVLGPAVGAYVLLLAAVLTGLATGLERGLDRSLVAYRVGVALPVAAVGFLAAFAGARALL